MGQVVDISAHNFKREDKLFLDANFWLFMYGSNDQIISLICAREKLKLVTDDGDFRHGEITVLTANKKC